MRYDWRRHPYTNLCRHTGLTIPECSCPACIKRQIGRAAASRRGETPKPIAGARSRRGSGSRAVGKVLLASAAAFVLLIPATAQASIVTIGSPLTAPFVSSAIGNSVTLSNSALGESGVNVTSPVDGVIVRWRITQATGGPFALRVLSPVSGTTDTGGAASAPETPVGPSTQTFATNLPIKAGQTIGLDNAAGTDQIGVAAGVPGSSFTLWQPPLASGQTRAGGGPGPAEIGFNADVATQPSNADRLGKVKRNTHKGTATLAVTVPGPGTLALTGKGIKAQRLARNASASKAVTRAGTAKLLIKAKGRAKRRLNKSGKAEVTTVVTYTPTGDLPGVPNAQTKRITLIKKR